MKWCLMSILLKYCRQFDPLRPLFFTFFVSVVVIACVQCLAREEMSDMFHLKISFNGKVVEARVPHREWQRTLCHYICTNYHNTIVTELYALFAASNSLVTPNVHNYKQCARDNCNHVVIFSKYVVIITIMWTNCNCVNIITVMCLGRYWAAISYLW